MLPHAPIIRRGPVRADDFDLDPTTIYRKRRLARTFFVHLLALAGVGLWLSDVLAPFLGARLRGLMLILCAVTIAATLITMSAELNWLQRARRDHRSTPPLEPPN